MRPERVVIDKFNRQRLFDSIERVCLANRRSEGQASATANTVCDAVIKWLDGRQEVTSSDLVRITTKELKKYDPDSAYLYAHQHTLI